MGFGAVQKAIEYMKNYPASLLEARGEKPLVGVFCSNVPEEMIHASGCIPVRILPTPGSAAGAQSELQPFTCALVRSCLVEAIFGKLAHFDGFVFTCACDSLKALLCLWEKHFPGKMTHNFNLPLNMGAKGVTDYYSNELEIFGGALGGIKGAKKPDPESLKKSIEAYNGNRELFRKLRDYTGAGGPLASSDFIRLLWARLLMPVEMSTGLVEELLSDLEASKAGAARPESARPVLLWGGFIPDLSVFEFIEEADGRIAGDNFCSAGRYLGADVPDNLEPLAALGQRFMTRNPCPTLHPGYTKNSDQVMRSMLRESGAVGVIFLFQKFCDPYGFDYPLYARTLEKLNVPHLMIELEEGPEGLSGQAKTRIEAFLETLSR